MTKTLYCIRHGTALHNIYFKKIGEMAYRRFKDTPLMHEGVNDVAKLRQNWDDINKLAQCSADIFYAILCILE